MKRGRKGEEEEGIKAQKGQRSRDKEKTSQTELVESTVAQPGL